MFLPVNKKEIRERGWEQADFVIVTGDAYVDHPSFGSAIISRVLENAGYRVAVIAQPDFRNEESVTVCGEPRLAFLVSAGNMDSMVNRYTVNKKPRSTDAYTPGGKAGVRPDRAVTVYCNLIRKKYKKIPVVIGGIEASLRRLGHYDYWQDKVKRSVLLDSGADILQYGMGELSMLEIANALNAGTPVDEIKNVRGTVVKARELNGFKDVRELPTFDEILSDKKAFALSFKLQSENTDPFTAVPLAEKYGENRYIVQNVPQRPLTTKELDEVYELPYERAQHPSYKEKVSALDEVKFSISLNRGCFGSCSFCSLNFHQGRIVQCRSRESVIREAKLFLKDPDFKGYIHDVGGPTADFTHPACDKQLKCGACKERQCLFPEGCKALKADHSEYIKILRELRGLPGVKKVFVRSGVRFDYVVYDKKHGAEFMRELCKYHVSGQLRVAPEHVSDGVLSLMGKPGTRVYAEFKKLFEKANKEVHMDKQYLVPYLISSHPGSTLKDAVALAEAIRDMGYMPEQVQDFYPTPFTAATCMYYTGYDPRTMKKVYTAHDPHEKAMQRALMQYKKPENYRLVREALIAAGREDLIGFDKKKCLIPPREIKGTVKNNGNGTRGSAGKKQAARKSAGR
ncbi:MAG: YgiQ family radical SAM protein [Eubacteriales bacterium]|nr:YgiQ family radical SAM protein [Eubacteriales bacterium]